MNDVLKYIEENWSICVRQNTEDKDTLIGMPYPYTVPAVGHFEEMYYWDTYFTNKGLLETGHFEYAKNNVMNMEYMINKYGYMPNGNRIYYLPYSQPPFFSEMVKDIYEYSKDKEWLKKAYKECETEHKFWMSKRISDIGLNVYGVDMTKVETELLATIYQERVQHTLDESAETIARHYGINGESGWDCNPRWGYHAYDFIPIDLNSLLYMYENNMSYFARELGYNDDFEKWDLLAKKRKELVLKYMKNNDGLFFDYDFKNNEHSDIFSAASYYTMFAGLADEKESEILVKNLERLEYEHGIVACEKNDFCGNFQWNYPNGWACIQYIVVMGLIRYGYTEEAKRIARKYVSIVEKNFEASGKLWEKYNVVTGRLDTISESKKKTMPPMMGWSAGVYICLKKFLNN